MNDEEIKKLTIEFHNTYEKLAPKYGYKTRKDTRKLDFNFPNGKLMYETIKQVFSNKKHMEVMNMTNSKDTSYKINLLNEFKTLTEMITRLDSYLEGLRKLEDLATDERGDRILSTMYRQLDCMTNYQTCLKERILLEMNVDLDKI